LIDKHSELLIKYVIDIVRNREWQLAYSLFLQDKLEADRTELQNRLRDMDAAVAQANETGRADYIMRTEIEHLKQDL
jgi:protein HOOK3